MTWVRVGEVEITPWTAEAVVGPVEVSSAGGLEVRHRQTTATPFRWGFGLLSFRGAQGLELGTVKVWPRPELSACVLGAGLSPDSNSGVLVFEPRSYGLAWVRAGFPLSVEFFASVALDLPADRFEAPGFVTSGGGILGLVRSGNFGRLLFGP